LAQLLGLNMLAANVSMIARACLEAPLAALTLGPG
jgi:hypothetical protein